MLILIVEDHPPLLSRPLPEHTVFVAKTDLDRLPDLFRLLRTDASPNGRPPQANGSTCHD